MNRFAKIVAALAVLTMVAAACGGDSGTTDDPTDAPTTDIPVGGTLKAAMTQDFFNGLDPSQEYYSVSWALLQCCMARTLMSYTGAEADDGGGVPTPDLAASEPTVSDDGLTWTVEIKDGVMFGNPLNREIVAEDFINAFNRFEDPDINSESYPFFYTDIEGYDWPDGDGDVSGVKAIDDKTLEFTLRQPNPDMPFLLSLAATAPLPTELVESHYDAVELGQFLVSSGPYEWEGMEGLDLTGKNPPSGMKIEESYVFVRNEAYDQSTDTLRNSYVDRIEIQVGGEVQDLLDRVDSGVIDWCIDCGVTSTTLQAYSADPEKTERVRSHPADALAYTGLNVFEAPMDDVHVRKALNWALDKAAMLRLAGGPVAGVIAEHFVPPGMMGGLNADYAPYATTDGRGDPAKAMEEMAQSKYDTNGDGVCDGDVCNVIALAVSNDNDAIKALEVMDASFEPIGINLDIKTLNYNALVDRCSTLEGHAAFCQAGWGKDYPSPFTFFFPLLDGGANGSNYSFMGATAEDLEAAGYTVEETDANGLGVPNITEDIKACQAAPLGAEQDQCWADLDVKVMEEIVPLIPRRFPNDVDVLGERIVNYAYDQFSGIGAITHMALADAGA